MGGRRVRIDSTTEVPDVAIPDRTRHLGKIIFRSEQKPVVVCGEGLLRIDAAATEDGEPLELRSVPFRTRFQFLPQGAK